MSVHSLLRKIQLIFASALLGVLTACGGGSSGGSTSNAPPYIGAMVFSFSSGVAPASMPTATVTVLDSTTGTPITNANVTINGVALTYNSAPTHTEYEGNVAVAPGAKVTMVVSARGKAYTSTGTQGTSAPIISAPTTNTTWLSSNPNTVSWSGGAPLTNASMFLVVTNAADPVGGPSYIQILPTSPTSFTVPGNSALPIGSNDLMLGITTSTPVVGADPASVLIVGEYSSVPITVTPTPIPSNFQTTPSGSGQNDVSWAAVTGATSYNIYWSTTAANANPASGIKIANATSPYAHTGLINGTPYYYTVTAVGIAGESLAAPVSTATPGVPYNVNVSPGNTQATVTWPVLTGATSYNLYWSTTAANATPASGIKITNVISPYVHTGLTNGTRYYYTVTAVYAGGESHTSSLTGATSGARQLGGALQGYPIALSNTVSTLLSGGATGLPISYPSGITTDGHYLYYVDGNIKKTQISSGLTTVVAGASPAICGLTDGTGAAANFCNPSGITTDGTNLYVADTGNNSIRKIVISTGVVTTLAGSAVVVIGPVNSTGTSARFNSPSGITTDGINLYVAESGNSDIRKIVIATAAVTTVASGFSGPLGITTDGVNLYVTNVQGYIINQIVISTGVVSVLAGSGGVGSADGTGTAATFTAPYGITTDGTNLYVVDAGCSTIRKIVIATGVVTTIAGVPSFTGLGAGIVNGSGAVAQFSTPHDITTDDGSLFVSDTYNSAIRQIQ